MGTDEGAQSAPTNRDQEDLPVSEEKLERRERVEREEQQQSEAGV